MGCSSSRTADSEAVLQCLKRKRLMRAAVKYRHEFAFAHLLYIQTLRNVGDALCHISEGHLSNMQNRSPTVPLAPSDLPPPSPLAPAAPSGSHSLPIEPVNSPVILPLSSFLSKDSLSMPFDPEASPASLDLNDSPPSWKGSRMVSSLKSGDFSPFYSPAREDSDDGFIAFAYPPPSVSMYAPSSPSPPPSSLWDPFNLFNASRSPYHLQEQRHMKETQDIEEMGDLDQVTDEDGMPDLEEEEQKEYEKDQPEQIEDLRHEKESPTAHSGFQVPELVKIITEEVLEKQGGIAVVLGQEANVKREKAEEETESPVSMMANNLPELVGHIDEEFSKAFDSGKELTAILETQLVHPHMSILDIRDSFKFFNGITWHRSLNAELDWKEATNETSDVAQCGMSGSHSTTLERLYTWEKKLYREVKAAEVLRITFDRKCKQMNNLVSKRGDPNLIEKTSATIRGLDTQIMVSLRAIHSASKRIQQLTNADLYPQLAELLGGLTRMWKEMLDCHKTQKSIALKIKTLDKSNAGDEASDTRRNATIQLEHELGKWGHYFCVWVGSQSKYIYALFAWLRICHMDPEAHMQGGAMSPNWTTGIPFVYLLVKKWHSSLTCLEQHTEVLDAIKEFAGALHGLQIIQSEELIQKKRMEDFTKGLEHRTVLLHGMEKTYWKAALSEDQSTLNNASQEKKTPKNMVEEKYTKDVHDCRETTLSNLQEILPRLFEALISFTEAVVTEFEKLHEETERLKSQPMDKDLEE